MKNWKNQGWVRLHRKIEDNFLYFLEPFTKAQAWIDLFLNANHKDGYIQIRGNVIPIKRGQIGWSELTMVKRWTWSKNKVRRFLKLLETEQQILINSSKKNGLNKPRKKSKTPNNGLTKPQKQLSAEISSKTPQNDTTDDTTTSRFITTIITIIEYEKYQNDTPDDTAERQQKDSRRHINKNVKKDKNVKNKIQMVGFEKFYLAYPKKKAKVVAKKSWDKLKPSSSLLQAILKDIERRKKGDQWRKENGRYIPYPATYLNQCRWNDEDDKKTNFLYK
jgi:hypothetical protein|tara:strand:+ start:353 stop:1183 length:831 start_codon:yes stop_codon:yes gene_type:complete